MIYAAKYSSPVGELLLSAENGALTGLWLEGQKYYAATLTDDPVYDESALPFPAVFHWLDEYFAGNKPDVRSLPLAPAGSDFRQEVFRLLCEIPYGGVTSYGALAQKLSQKRGFATSARAVGNAVGHNPISIIIPCHRVLGSGNSLTGYAGGLGRKCVLLALEGIDTTTLRHPKHGSAL